MTPFHRPLSRPLDAAAVDALLAGRAVPGEQALGDALSLLRSSVERVEPSAALAAMLAAGVTPAASAAVRTAGPGRRWALRSVVAVAAVSASLVGAASANALPGPLQRGVSGLVNTLTPLELPAPADAVEAPVDPVAPPAVIVPDTVEVVTGDESGERGSGSERDAEVPDNEAPDADVSDNDVPDNDVPDNEAPDSDVPDSDVPDNDEVNRSAPANTRSGDTGTAHEGPAVDEPTGDPGAGEPDSSDTEGGDSSSDTADPARSDGSDSESPAP